MALSPSSTEALVRLDCVPDGNWDRLLEEALRVDSNVLGVESVSYWRFRLQPSSSIVCELSYHARGQRFERGFALEERASPVYFAEIRRTPVLSIEDTEADVRASDIAPYLKVHHIGALLDTPIRMGGEMVGILCHEHEGKARRWTSEEQQFALSVGQILANRLESRARTQAEEEGRRAALLADVMADASEYFGDGPAASLVVERALPVLGDLALLMGFDGHEVQYLAGTHIDPEKRPTLDAIARHYPMAMDGPGLAAHAILERQSLLLPSLNPEAVLHFGVDQLLVSELANLRLGSVMAVPFVVRGQLGGAMVFGSTSRRYDQDDLRFAEVFAERIGLILENARLYQKARDAIAARDAFLALASHELRTPLTTLRLAAQNLVREAARAAPEEMARSGERIARQTARLDRLVERLLNASEMGAGPPSINRESVDLTQIVDDMTDAFRSIAQAAGSSLVTMPHNGPVVGRFDPIRMQQVLGNLLDNAIKFGQGKPVEVAVEAVDGVASLRVRDHGYGIPEEDRSGLFQRYFRGSSAEGIGGLGLGLHIVREIAEAHGGRVRLDSKLGCGSTFTVELPLETA